MTVHILTECYVDTLLVETIAPAGTGYNHQHACTKVLSTMNNKLADRPAIGIIDDDKVEPKAMNDFKCIKIYTDALKLYKHISRAHYIIKICPAMERFILNTAQQCNISPATYHLPTTLSELLKVTKPGTSKNNISLKQLFCALKQQNAENVCKLAQWIEHLKTFPYQPSIDSL
ncbi:MAG: hypothetical protein LBR10_04525 [Prevotellaceae bacterium]|jgi:hypothetical protein|nr:hypothetical protein [Prevotellaceae bacterium]